MDKSLEQVEQFNTVFGHSVNHVPQFPTQQEHEMRMAFLREEIKELDEAYQERDLAKYADAIVDTKYVLNGLVIESGMQHVLQPMFDEVHKANMSKACKSKENADDVVESLRVLGTEAHKVFRSGAYVVYRTEDKKVMKPLSFMPPDLTRFVRAVDPNNIAFAMPKFDPS